jgi:citrate lyase subunit beta/citryl-CoA lyase
MGGEEMSYHKNRLRRTMLYVPGSNSGMLRDAHIYGPDSIMFDLEDSVSLAEKDSARSLVYNALTTIDYADKETVVRVNALNTEFGMEDLKAMVAAAPDLIRLPKAETAEDIITADKIITDLEAHYGMAHNSIGLMAAIESALGIINAYQIAMASPRMVGIAIGAEDFVTDLKTTRSDTGVELLTARSMLVYAARAAGISALDTVYSDVNNEEGFRKEVTLIKQLGFDGKSVINPRQIEPTHAIFAPTEKELHYAQRVLEAIKEANRKHSGVISLDGKMIDKPVAGRAQRIIDLYNASEQLGKGMQI